jgi:CBS domain-containing protein
MRKISEVMTTKVKVVRPDDTLQNAATMMAQQDVGSLPVCDGQRLKGMITDRDITIRAIANGRGCETPVSEVMSENVIWCTEDDDTQAVLDRMGSEQIRRIPVVDSRRNLVGIVALGDFAVESVRNVDDALRDISKPA